MAQVALKVNVVEKGIIKTILFDTRTSIYDACTIIRQRMPEAANLGNPKDYGLYLADGIPTRGVWMENAKSLEYYLVRQGDTMEYRKKTRSLKVRTLDGALRSVVVDDSQTLGQLMVVICTKLGITNHEEYSLTRDVYGDWDTKSRSSLHSKEGSKSSLIGSLTRGRSKEKKHAKDRKRFQTDEEVEWLDHSRTLRELSISEEDTVLLRRKFYFSDQNIDSSDPVQLNLLYVQCRNGVLDGTHPVARDEAFGLAALQCQIQFGDFVESKQKGGFLDVHEFLPKDYVKSKDAEKRILSEYRQIRGMTESNARMEYIRRCRGLKTYGVTFFPVKEKMKGRNKLVPRLLGVNKDCVIRVDEKTKDVIKVYPLEIVRRWAASTNTFTLDFGDYQEQYYSVQTPDGEKIAQLIGGYIDILLRKRRAKDSFGIEGDEGSTMLEDMIAPAKATLMSHGALSAKHPEEGSVALPAILRPGADTDLAHYGSLTRAQYGAVGGHVMTQTAEVSPGAGQPVKIVDAGMGKAQRALIGVIEESVKQVEQAKEELGQKVQLPPLGDDETSRQWKELEMIIHKQTVTDRLAEVGAATAQVVQLSGGETERIDHTAVGAAVSTIGKKVPDVTKGVRTVAALMEDTERSDLLLEATRRFCGSISELLNCVSPEHEEPRTKVLSTAGEVGEYSHTVIRTMTEQLTYEREFQDLLLELAKRVATATAQLVLRAKTVSGSCQDSDLRDRIIHSATRCAFTTSQLVACARVVAPTIDSPACRQQLIDASKQVLVAVDELMKDADACKDDAAAVGDLKDAGRIVVRAVEDLLAHVRAGPKRPSEGEGRVETALVSAARFATETEPSDDLIRQARVLTEATTHLVQYLRSEADAEADAERQRRLREAAQRLADATASVVEAATLCASNPDDLELQRRLRMAAEELRMAMANATRDHIRRKAMLRLEEAARRAAAAAVQNISAAKTSEASNANVQSVQDLGQQCKEVAVLIPRIAISVQRSQSKPYSQLAQLDLISTCEEFLAPGGRLVSSGRLAAPTVRDQSSSMHLSNTATVLAESLTELRVAINRARDAWGPFDLDTAIEIVRSLDVELTEYRTAYLEKRLYPWPGETAEDSLSRLISSTRSVGSAMSQIVSAASEGDENYVNAVCREVVDGLRIMTTSMRGVCATHEDYDGSRMIDCGRTIMRETIHLFEQLKTYLRDIGDTDQRNRLAEAAKAVTTALSQCVSYLPGQEGVDSALRAVNALLSRIDVNQLPVSHRSPKEAADDLLTAAKLLAESTQRLVGSAYGTANQISEAANDFVKCLDRFVSAGLEVAYHQQDRAVKEQIVDALRDTVRESYRLLEAIKATAMEPTSPAANQALIAASRAVIESINRVINICLGGAPWQRECDSALRSIQAMYSLYENPVEPISSFTYYECLDVVTDKPRSLGAGMTGIAQHARNGDMDLFCHSVRDVATAICELTEAGAQAAYLVGVAEASSVPGTPALVNMNQMEEHGRAVREACSLLTSGRITQPEVLETATTVAKHTSILANMCREAASRTPNPSAKKQFIHCAREVASSTAELIKTIKNLDIDFSESNKQLCAEAARSLTTSLDNMFTFAASPEFAGVRARISQKGREAQNAIITAGRGVLDGACDIIKAAKALASSPKEPACWERLADHTKTLSDSVKLLVTAMRECAPGKKECDLAIERMQQLIRGLDQAELGAISQTLPSRTNNTEQGFLEQAGNSAHQILENVEGFRVAAKSRAEELGHKVTEMTSYFDLLCDGIIGAASLMTNSRRQIALLNRCKTAAECQLQLLYSARDAGGNPKAVQYHRAVDNDCDHLCQSLTELLQTITEAIFESGAVSTMIDGLGKAIAKADEVALPEGTYEDYLARMIKRCKEIDRIAKEMSVQAYGNVEGLGGLALELSRNYTELAEDTPKAVALANTPENGQHIRSAVQQLGAACIDLVKTGSACRANPADQLIKRDVGDSSRLTSDKVALVLAALEAGARGATAPAKEACTVSGIIGDADTTIMFATAGTLNVEKEIEAFLNHQEAISKTAKALVDDTKALVSGAESNQERLAAASQGVVHTVVQLADLSKVNAVPLSPPNSEAQVTLESIASLVSEVRNREEGQRAGALAVQAALEAIAQGLKTFDSIDVPSYKGDPDELTRATKSVMETVEQAVSAGQSGSQDEAMAAAIGLRGSVTRILTACKAVAYSLERSESRYRCMDGGRDIAVKTALLLQSLLTALVEKSSTSRQSLLSTSRNVALAVTEFVAFVEMLKSSDWIISTSPLVMVEADLLAIADSIEAVSRQLDSLRTRSLDKDAVSRQYAIDEALEAAFTTSEAAASLVRAAVAAHRDWYESRKENLIRRQADDSQWTEGLLSAARMLSSATSRLYDATTAMLQGDATVEQSDSAAKQVAAAAAHLLVACKVKVDPASKAMQRLQATGNAVKVGAEHYVLAAKKAVEAEDERTLSISHYLVSGIAQVLSAKDDVVRKEKEMDEARGRLASIRRSSQKAGPFGTPISAGVPIGSYFSLS